MTSYLTLAAQIRTLLQQAIVAAATPLPRECHRHYWMAQKHSPNPWLSVKMAYEGHAFHEGHEPYDSAIAQVLTDLVLMHEALANLITVLHEHPTEPPDISLPKTRRTQ